MSEAREPLFDLDAESGSTQPRRPSPPLPRGSRSRDRGHDDDRQALLRSDARNDGPEEEDVPRKGDDSRVASLAKRKALWWRNVLITGIFILSWYTFATLLSLYNKWMFSPEYYNFSFPLFVTFCHMLVQWSLAASIRAIWPAHFRPKERPSRQDYVSKIFPTAAATGADIGLSNLSLKTITLSLYTMCKSSSLIFVLIFAFAFHLEVYSLRLISVIAFITFGVFLMVFNTTAVSIPGILMVFSASAIGGLRWALTSLLMHKKSMGMSNPFATIYWLAPLMAVTLGCVSMILEGWFTVLGSGFFDGVGALGTMGVIVLPGGIAFAMVASEYFIIQRAGIVPLSIAGIFKEVTTISISAWVFGDQLTELNIIGVVITVCGIALYSYHKYQKSVNSPVPLDSHGNPTQEVDEAASHETRYVPAPTSAVPLSSLMSHDRSNGSHGYPPPPPAYVPTEEDLMEERADRFEGWNQGDEDEDENEDEADEEELDDEEVERRRNEREEGEPDTPRSWGGWWGKDM
ncbi:solute carrier family 35, member C2, partial [Tremellales sp. Uapishka_1]